MPKERTDSQRAIAQAVGSVIRRLRTARGWSQEALAREAKVSRETIRRSEAGLHIPDWGTLDAVAAALEVDVTTLLGWTGEGARRIRWTPERRRDLRLVPSPAR